MMVRQPVPADNSPQILQYQGYYILEGRYITDIRMQTTKGHAGSDGKLLSACRQLSTKSLFLLLSFTIETFTMKSIDAAGRFLIRATSEEEKGGRCVAREAA